MLISERSCALFFGKTLEEDVNLAVELARRLGSKESWEYHTETELALVRLQKIASICLIMFESRLLTLTTLNNDKDTWAIYSELRDESRKEFVRESTQAANNVLNVFTQYRNETNFTEIHTVRQFLRQIAKKQHPDRSVVSLPEKVIPLIQLCQVFFVPKHVTVIRLRLVLEWYRHKNVREKLFLEDNEMIETKIERISEALDAIEGVVLMYHPPG